CGSSRRPMRKVAVLPPQRGQRPPQAQAARGRSGGVVGVGAAAREFGRGVAEGFAAVFVVA
ncbi:hypothetical protein, partial [Tahibacter caeni]|uniref:hypothetical protein n=1 Tax=Tahibacter caeni TaxID=1453545 RepID=UPI002147FA06